MNRDGVILFGLLSGADYSKVCTLSLPSIESCIDLETRACEDAAHTLRSAW